MEKHEVRPAIPVSFQQVADGDAAPALREEHGDHLPTGHAVSGVQSSVTFIWASVWNLRT
jgi:hypothetical protein